MTIRNVLTRAIWLALYPALVLWVLCLPSTASAAGNTTVSVSAPTQPIAAGEQFTVGIAVVPDTAIAGMQFNLSFDASLVAVSTVQEGDLLNQGGATSYFDSVSIDNEAGKVTGVFGAITTPGMTVSTPGTFATITFTAKTQRGTCALTLSNVIVGDVNGNPVTISVVDGTVSIDQPSVLNTTDNNSIDEGATPDNEGSTGATAQRSVFSWWALSAIIGWALLLIAVTVAVVLFRRRKMVRALQASENLEPKMRTSPSASRLQQKVVKVGDSVKQRPRLAKCPFCRSITFNVVEEDGSRRCSDCNSVLPPYVKGND